MRLGCKCSTALRICVEQCVANERDKNAHEYRVPENALTYFLWSAASCSALFCNSEICSLSHWLVYDIGLKDIH
jgi:hypothetical protein